MAAQREHTARRHAVQAIEKSLSDIGPNQYYPKDIEDLPIRILPMPLTSDGYPLFEDCFFDPYKKPLDDPVDQIDYPSYQPEHPLRTPMDGAREIWFYLASYLHSLKYDGKIDFQDRSRQAGDFRAQLWEYEESVFWTAVTLCDTASGPWFKCIMLESVISDDDRITRGELMCICRLIIKLLSVRCYLDHNVIPIMLLSLMGPRHGRILLGHHDGTNLVIRKSELFDFRQENIPAFKIFLRWWCSSGIGNTITS